MKRPVLFFCFFLFLIPILKAERFQPDDFVEMEAFLDGIVRTLIDEKHIAGATMSVVYDGDIVISKGYGYADLDGKIEVDPEKTLFRIASISKMFTWFSVLQLVEQGKLDLDADINEYLTEFKIPGTFDEPVTLRSLMAHAAGFEERLLHLFVKDKDDMIPLGELLPLQLPERVRPPMRHSSYSNHSTGLAQHIVELTSGMAFEDYAEKHILYPLEMKNTTFRQPIPVGLSENMSGGYLFNGSEFKRMYFEYVPMSGVGGASSSAVDIARFMKMLMNKACHKDVCLLDSATYELMKQPALIHAEGVNPARHGIMDMSFNNIEILGHGGATFWFHSVMAILPEHDLGFFLSFNSAGGSGTTRNVMNKLVERYYTDPKPLHNTISLDDEYLERFEGKYMTNRRSHSSFFKLRAIENPTLITKEKQKLRMDEPRKAAAWYLPVDSTTFREKNSNKMIAFELNDGKAEYLFKDHFCFRAFERIKGAYNPDMHKVIFRASLTAVVYVLLILPLWYLVRRYYLPARKISKPIPLNAKLMAWLCSACLAVAYILISSALDTGRELILDVPAGLKAGLLIPFAVMFFLILMIWRSIEMWKNKETALRNNLFYSLVVIIYIAALWQLHFWNFMGWRF